MVLNMSSEISRFDIDELRRLQSSLEKRIQNLQDQLSRQTQASSEMELRLTKWSGAVLVMAVAFTLFITILTKHPPKTADEPAVAAPSVDVD
jgi:hypothetical protein